MQMRLFKMCDFQMMGSRVDRIMPVCMNDIYAITTWLLDAMYQLI